MEWRRFFRLAALALVVWGLGMVWGMAYSVPLIGIGQNHRGSAFASTGRIFSANIRVLLGCWMGLVTCSAARLATLLLNGLYLGFEVKSLASQASPWKILRLVAPHGLLEIPGILIAGTIGLMGGPAARALNHSGRAGLKAYARPVMGGVLASTALILIAAVIEAWNIARP